MGITLLKQAKLERLKESLPLLIKFESRRQKVRRKILEYIKDFERELFEDNLLLEVGFPTLTMILKNYRHGKLDLKR